MANSSDAVVWVQKELESSFNRALQSLEQYVDEPTNRNALKQAGVTLHSCAGALRMIEVHGAALLCDEMNKLINILVNESVEDVAAAQEALSRSIVQLPAYLERVLQTGHDIPLVLLPVLNDLRSLRNVPLLSENTLFVMNVGSAKREDVVISPDQAPAGEDIVTVATKLRKRFQAGLLGLFKGDQLDSNFATMGVVAENLAQAARRSSLFQFWWVCAGVLESLRDGGLRLSSPIKKLLGQADREMKRLVEEGAEAVAESQNEELFNSLLYYIAASKSEGPRVLSIKRSFNLEHVRPSAAEIERQRQSLGGPSEALMRTVAAAINQDIARVKDTLDIFVRTSQQDREPLVAEFALLKRIADTLNVLGLTDESINVSQQREKLVEWMQSDSEIEESALIRIAEQMLKVEAKLEARLRDMVRKRTQDEDGLHEDEDAYTQFIDVKRAAIRECLVNVARIKECVSSFTEQGGDVATALEPVPELIHQANAALIMLNKERAAVALERVGFFIKHLARMRSREFGHDQQDILADALVGIEYYLETLNNGRKDPWHILENCERCLSALQLDDLATDESAAETSVEMTPAEAPTPPQDSATDFVETPVEITDQLPKIDASEGEADDVDSADVLAAAADEDVLAPIDEALLSQLPESEPSFEMERESDESDSGGAEEDDVTGLDFDTAIVALEAAKMADEPVVDPTTPVPVPFADEPDHVAHEPDTDEQPLIELTADEEAALGENSAEDSLAKEDSTDNVEAQAIDEATDEAMDEASEDDSDVVAAPIESKEIPLKEDPTGVSEPAATKLDAESTLMSITQSFPCPFSGDEPVLELTSDDIDPEVIELFIEEAREQDQLVVTRVKDWRNGIDVDAALGDIRRAFHTLKGSGRLVGAYRLGEFSWTIESLLNRVLSGTLESSPAIIDLIEASHRPLNELIEQIEVGAEPATDIQEFAMRAWLLAGNIAPDQIAALAEASETAEESVEESSEAKSDVIIEDEQLAAIFSKEALAHIEDIESYLDDSFGLLPPYTVSETLYRALHTLTGSADTAGVEPVVSLVAPLNEYARHLQSEDRGYGKDIRSLLARITQTVKKIVEHIEDQARPMPDWKSEVELLEKMLASEKAAQSKTVDSFDETMVDRELLSIFADEAVVLLEQCDQILKQLKSSPSNQDLVAELQRHLHTLKGSARMAGLHSMGELSHELETILAHEREAGERLPLIQLRFGLDELYQAAESLNSHGAVPDLAPIINSLRAERTADDEFEEDTAVNDAVEVDAEDAEFTVAAIDQLNDAVIDEGQKNEDVADDKQTVEQQQQVTAFPAEQGSHGEMVKRDLLRELSEELASVAKVTAEKTAVPKDLPLDIDLSSEGRPAFTRVDTRLLDELLDEAGEVSIFRSRLEQQIESMNLSLSELSRTVSRLRDQLRALEIETEAQIRFGHFQETKDSHTGFDPLEMDRYSTIQELSRALAESVGDLGSIRDILESRATESEDLLNQQSRVTAQIQDVLVRTRMVPFRGFASRFERLVRKTAQDENKLAEVIVKGGEQELDRDIAQHLVPVLEHLVRNAVIHGLESAEQRQKVDKLETGVITIAVDRQGSEMVVTVSDDGAGLNYEKIAKIAIKAGLVGANQTLTEEQYAELILRPGFTTATELTHAAGRGVGLDVVAKEIEIIGGTLTIDSTEAQGTRFILRVPLALSVTQAVVVQVEKDRFAIPMHALDGLLRLPRKQIERYLIDPSKRLAYGDRDYRCVHLAGILGRSEIRLPDGSTPLLLMSAGNQRMALAVEAMKASREIVVKPVGSPINTVPGVAGATIAGDGRVVVVLDVNALVRSTPDEIKVSADNIEWEDKRPLVLVVDDSITVRRVTQRLLERNGMRVVTAKDGVDALAVLQERRPALIMLDIEMPRMDGFEVATHIRNDVEIQDVPIVMVTSRAGKKHQAKAFEIGVDGYLGKPYQENKLLETIKPLIERSQRLK